MAEPVRIQKALADAGVASRRAAETLVEAGRVTVNGQPAVTGQRVDPSTDALAVDGRPVVPAGRRTYLVMHKPAGVTSTVSDRHAERTVLDLLPAELRGTARLYPVGRLDKDSEGLLLLTDDGEWTQRLLHPRYAVEREYAVGLRAPLDDGQLEALDEGIELEEGLARLVSLRLATRAESARLERDPSSQAGRLRWYRAVLTQGWRRQLRRMFAAVEAPVERLVRVRIGTLRLDDLPPGSVRVLSAAERDRLSASARRP
jgi:23S rRNA pseudouridine2605 synthase